MGLLHNLLDRRLQFLKDLKAHVLYMRDFNKDLERYIGNEAVMPKEQTQTINVADASMLWSSRIGWEWAQLLPEGEYCKKQIQGTTAGDYFTHEVRTFLQDAIAMCAEIRPTAWKYRFDEPGTKDTKNPKIKVSEFAQYYHLKKIDEEFKAKPELQAVFGADYVVDPDIVIFSEPYDATILGGRPEGKVATYSPLIIRDGESNAPILQGSVSCKLTMRSDRAQNVRLEAENLIGARKGRTPNIAFVTAEPLPSRIASLAMGTGSIDCIYHAGLYELIEAVDNAAKYGAKGMPTSERDASPELLPLLTSRPESEADEDAAVAEAPPTRQGIENQQWRLRRMIEQGRLRDISDLVLDLMM